MQVLGLRNNGDSDDRWDTRQSAQNWGMGLHKS